MTSQLAYLPGRCPTVEWCNVEGFHASVSCSSSGKRTGEIPHTVLLNVCTMALSETNKLFTNIHVSLLNVCTKDLSETDQQVIYIQMFTCQRGQENHHIWAKLQ